jgi:hypothetical protein
MVISKLKIEAGTEGANTSKVWIYVNGTKPVSLTMYKNPCVSKVGKVRDMAPTTCLQAYRQNNEIHTYAQTILVGICIIRYASQLIRPPNVVLVTKERNS